MATNDIDCVGRFVWRELMTPDVQASQAFYAALFGWRYEHAPMEGGGYPLILGPRAAAGQGQGGMLSTKVLPMPNVPPAWMSYVAADPDQAARAAAEAGGQVHRPPFDIPGVGRTAVIADPAGAVFMPLVLGDDYPPEIVPGPSEFCWEQLNTSDVAGAKAFYARVLGYSSKPFAGGGSDVLVRKDGREAATLMQAPPGVPAHWMTYVVAPDLAAARDKVKALGGKVIMDEIPIPGMGKIAVIADNFGAILGLFQPAEGLGG